MLEILLYRLLLLQKSLSSSSSEDYEDCDRIIIAPIVKTVLAVLLREPHKNMSSSHSTIKSKKKKIDKMIFCIKKMKPRTIWIFCIVTLFKLQLNYHYFNVSRRFVRILVTMAKIFRSQVIISCYFDITVVLNDY